MFENVVKFLKKFNKKDKNATNNSKDAAKERLHLVLMQDRANVSADFLELMKQEIIEVIKKYIEIDEKAIDVRLTNKENDDGTNGAPALYANIPILNIKNDARKVEKRKAEQEEKLSEDKEINNKKENKNDGQDILENNEKKLEIANKEKSNITNNKKEEIKDEKAKDKIKSENNIEEE